MKKHILEDEKGVFREYTETTEIPKKGEMILHLEDGESYKIVDASEKSAKILNKHSKQNEHIIIYDFQFIKPTGRVQLGEIFYREVDRKAVEGEIILNKINGKITIGLRRSLFWMQNMNGEAWRHEEYRVLEPENIFYPMKSYLKGEINKIDKLLISRELKEDPFRVAKTEKLNNKKKTIKNVLEKMEAMYTIYE